MMLLFSKVCGFFHGEIWKMSNQRQELVLTSLESLGRDETFKSLESLVRLFQKVSQIIILFFLMFLAGKLFEKHNNYDIWKKLMHRNAIKMAEGVKIVGYFLKYGLLD